MVISKLHEIWKLTGNNCGKLVQQYNMFLKHFLLFLTHYYCQKLTWLRAYVVPQLINVSKQYHCSLLEISTMSPIS